MTMEQQRAVIHTGPGRKIIHVSDSSATVGLTQTIPEAMLHATTSILHI